MTNPSRHRPTQLGRGVLRALLCILAAATPAYAHHIRGLPHYTYTENYPNVPTVKEDREVGKYTMTFTYFRVPGAANKIDLALYVKETRTSAPYAGDVIYAVYTDHEDPTTAHSVKAYRNKNNIYKAGWEYEIDGLYYVRVRFKDDGGETIDEVFQIQMGETRVSYWFLGLAGGGIVLLIVAVAIIKKAQASKARGAREAEAS